MKHTQTHTFINIGTHSHTCACINKTKLIFWKHIYFISCFCHGLCLLLTSTTRRLPCTYVVPTYLLASSLSTATSKCLIYLAQRLFREMASGFAALFIQVLPSWSHEVVGSVKFSHIISWFTDLGSRPELKLKVTISLMQTLSGTFSRKNITHTRTHTYSHTPAFNDDLLFIGWKHRVCG